MTNLRRGLAGAASVISFAALGLGLLSGSAVAQPPSGQRIGAVARPFSGRPRPGPGRRVSVGLFGDSVTQGLLIPDFETRGLAAQLDRDEARYGFSPGGLGLIPAEQYQWRFNSFGLYQLGSIPAGGWALLGAQEGAVVDSGTDGISGYSAATSSPTATATTTVSDPDIEVLYTSSFVPCSFTVTSGSRSWTIDSFLAGLITPAAEEYPIDLGPGTHTITVHGGSCGGLVFNGIVAQRPVAPGSVQMQVDDDGHSGRLPSTDLSSRVEEAILAQHYAVTVFLWGYLGELELAPGPTAQQYQQALLARAELARMNGGSCLIVAPTPLPVDSGQTRLVAGIERGVARQAGCVYTTTLTHLWPNPNVAINRGLVLVDGIHPTAKGYTKIAAALAPIVARLAR